MSPASLLCLQGSHQIAQNARKGGKLILKGFLISVGHHADLGSTSSWGSHNTASRCCYILILQSRKLRQEAVNNVHKVTELISGRARIRTKLRLTPTLPARSSQAGS